MFSTVIIRVTLCQAGKHWRLRDLVKFLLITKRRIVENAHVNITEIGPRLRED